MLPGVPPSQIWNVSAASSSVLENRDKTIIYKRIRRPLRLHSNSERMLYCTSLLRASTKRVFSIARQKSPHERSGLACDAFESLIFATIGPTYLRSLFLYGSFIPSTKYWTISDVCGYPIKHVPFAKIKGCQFYNYYNYMWLRCLGNYWADCAETSHARRHQPGNVVPCVTLGSASTSAHVQGSFPGYHLKKSYSKINVESGRTSMGTPKEAPTPNHFGRAIFIVHRQCIHLCNSLLILKKKYFNRKLRSESKYSSKLRVL